MTIYSYDENGIRTTVTKMKPAKPAKPSLAERMIYRWRENEQSALFYFRALCIGGMTNEQTQALLDQLPQEIGDFLRRCKKTRHKNAPKPDIPPPERLPRCGAKCCYPTEALARNVMDRRRTGLRVYKCPKCDAWHLTKLNIATHKRHEIITAAIQTFLKSNTF